MRDARFGSQWTIGAKLSVGSTLSIKSFLEALQRSRCASAIQDRAFNEITLGTNLVSRTNQN